MTKNRIAKIAALTVGMTFALSLSVNTAGAQTIAELQAQINALMAQLAALQGGTPTGTAVQFNMNLTVGSRGADVTALQQFLVSKGFLQMPAGVAYGYFGPLTRSAVAAWQAANGITPAVGYFGPISRARIATQIGPTVPGQVPGVPGTINTPGVEGILSATLAPVPSDGQTLNEGDNKAAVLGVELEADLSDIRIERIKVKLDSTQNNDRDFYRDIAGTMYVMEGSTVLATASLNADTVIEETSGNFYVTITGLNYIVRKDTEKTLTIAIDVEDSVDSDFTDGDDWTVTIPIDGIRGTDGAGINQFAPAAALDRDFTVEADEAETATLSVSTNSATPDTSEVICTSGSTEDECDDLELLRADFEAEDDDVTLTDLVVTITRGGDTSSATATTAYLYDGSTLIGSATVAGTTANAMSATFDDIDFVIDEDSTETLTVKIDVVDVLAAETTFTATITDSDTNIVAENSEGDDIAETGSATGDSISLRKVGVEVSLVSKSITTSGVPQTSGSPTSTSTLTAIFNVKVKAVGGDILLGTIASATPVFAVTGANNSFELFENGVASDSNTATSSAYSTPSGCTLVGTATCELSENEEVTYVVTFQIPGRLATGVALTSAIYSVGLQGVQWIAEGVSAAAQFTDFMDGDEDWRTSTVSFP